MSHRPVRGIRAALARRRDERGVVAVIMAISLTLLCVVAALVLDFGLVRVDRQIDKSAADSAALAGMHGLITGDSEAHPFKGVCSALRYLQENNDRFALLTDTSGTWTDGATPAASAPDGCTSATAQAQTCMPNTPSTWAKFSWTGSMGGKPLRVVIESGYVLSSSTGWSDDALDAAKTDLGATDQGGCDQLAVTISQSRKPGLGSLATSSDLATSLRTVARVETGTGGYAPAMLLLQQQGCSVLTVANGNTKIYVAGAAASNGLTQPGTIHSDSDAGEPTCGNNSWVYEGKQTDDIVAFAAPKSYTDQTNPDPSKPGQVDLYGNGSNSSGHLQDNPLNVCGSTKVYATPIPSSLCTSTSTITQSDRVYRQVVDKRYLSAVQQIRDAAESAFSSASTYPNMISGSNCNSPSAALTTGLTANDKLYVNCSSFGPGSPVTLNAGTIVFGGTIVNPANLSMPNATKVYVAGDSSVSANKVGISLSNNTAFSMHTVGSNMSGGACSSASTGPETGTLNSNKAVLVVKNGPINMSAGQFRACYTTVVMLSGRGGTGQDACMPASPSQSPPMPNPCTGSSYTPGTGQISQTGGNIDWTAPNQHELMVNADGTTNSTFESAWTDPNGPEDLAFWSESASNGPQYKLTGGSTSTIHLVGVFMIPNAQPVNLAGQFSQKLVNAQFVTGSLALSGGSTIAMQVDPASAITLPKLTVVGLVR